MDPAQAAGLAMAPTPDTAAAKVAAPLAHWLQTRRQCKEQPDRLHWLQTFKEKFCGKARPDELGDVAAAYVGTSLFGAPARSRLPGCVLLELQFATGTGPGNSPQETEVAPDSGPKVGCHRFPEGSGSPCLL